MGEVCLEQYFREINQRMIYVFDFFSERAFFMELIEQSDEISPRKTPFIAHSVGDPPQQLALDLLMGEHRDESDFDPFDDGYGADEDDLRIDDLDPDLFGSGNPEDYLTWKKHFWYWPVPLPLEKQHVASIWPGILILRLFRPIQDKSTVKHPSERRSHLRKNLAW